jgi:hypothetical protein
MFYVLRSTFYVLRFTIYSLLFTLVFNCAGVSVKDGSTSEPFSIQKNGELSDIKKIATMNAYNKRTGAFTLPTDTPVLLFGSTLSGRIDEIYTSSIEGGDEIIGLAKKLKLDKKLETAIQEIAVYTDGTLISEDSKQTLFTIGSKGKIDAIAFPITSGGYEQLRNGEKIQLYLVVFDVAKKDIQYLAIAKNVSLSEQEKLTSQTDPNQGLAISNTVVIKKTNEFSNYIQAEVKGTVPKADTLADEPKFDSATETASVEDKPKEEEKELTMFDKLLGPSLFGTTLVLWLFLP